MNRPGILEIKIIACAYAKVRSICTIKSKNDLVAVVPSFTASVECRVYAKWNYTISTKDGKEERRRAAEEGFDEAAIIQQTEISLLQSSPNNNLLFSLMKNKISYPVKM